jgi:hypothetical protein
MAIAARAAQADQKGWRDFMKALDQKKAPEAAQADPEAGRKLASRMGVKIGKQGDGKKRRHS